MLVTSCNRHDLLKTTLESFYAVCDIEPQELIIFEDSETPKPAFLDDFIWKQRGLRWIAGGERRGQAFACAKLIQEAKFDYVFWCEDDWLFQNRTSSFIRESKAILDAHPSVIMVSLRGNTGWHPIVKDGDLWTPQRYWRGVWGGWAWNPGLRRLKDCRGIFSRLGGQIGKDGLTHEEVLSKSLLDEGRFIADLNRPVITHIGGGRSRAIEKLPPLPKILIAVPTCFDFDYETHGGGPECKATGFHQNGPNEQVKAVRETWGADVAAFANVDLMFFYGKPKDGYPREPQADEVFLYCGDGYDSLIAKSVAICEYVANSDYKFLVKVDDDTAVYVERLLIEILENSFDYAGYLHGGVCSGGPGYLLSQQACKIITTQGRQPRHHYAEDVHVSRVLESSGIRPLMLPGHRPGFSAHYFFGDNKPDLSRVRIGEEVVTMHSVTAEQMRLWYQRLKRS
jgi:hypothetical protein